MHRLLQLTGLSLLLAGCALLHPPVPPPRVVPTATSQRLEERLTVLDEPFDTLTLTRVRGAVRVHVETQPLCSIQVYRSIDQGYSNGRVERGTPTLASERRGPCNGPPQPAVAEDVGLQTGPRLHVLGTTAQTGVLEVSYASLDARFAGQAVPLSQQAQLLVHGKQVAELPLGLIVNRMQLSTEVVAGADAVLANPGADREQLRSRLTELWALQVQGVEDPRLHERGLRVYMRLKTYLDPELQPAPSAQSKPGLTALATDAEASDFLRAEVLLPNMCLATVAGGETVLGALALTGPVGLMLEFTKNLLQIGYTQSLTHECCVWAMSMLMHADDSRCDTDVELFSLQAPRQSEPDTTPQPQAMRPLTNR